LHIQNRAINITEPASHEVDISGDEEDAACAEDMNFQLSGFSVKGKVVDDSAEGGGELVVGLHSADGGLVDKREVQSDGSYEFKVRPGVYTLSVVDSVGTSQCVDRKNIKVEVVKSPVAVSPDFHLTGHNLAVRVKDEAGSAISNAKISLRSGNKLKLEDRVQESKEGGGWIYSLQSDASGPTQFSCVPPGDYTLGADWEENGVKLSFPSKSISAAVDKKAFELVAESLDVSSVIVSPSGKGIGKVELWLDGEKKTSTDASGRYMLKGLKSRSYRLEAKKTNYEFTSREWTASSSKAVPQFAVKSLV